MNDVIFAAAQHLAMDAPVPRVELNCQRATVGDLLFGEADAERSVVHGALSANEHQGSVDEIDHDGSSVLFETLLLEMLLFCSPRKSRIIICNN